MKLWLIKEVYSKSCVHTLFSVVRGMYTMYTLYLSYKLKFDLSLSQINYLLSQIFPPRRRIVEFETT